MKVSCISFTANGSRLNRKLCEWMNMQGMEAQGCAFPRYAADAGLTPLQGSLRDWCQARFNSSDVLIFFGAAGIAVRGIAPFVKDKKTDPAVLVVDEQGNFVISLLSGHMGGANEMTQQVADFLGATAVITTGTDVNHTLAVDVFSTANQLQLQDMQLAKQIAAALIDKEPVGFFSELPVEGSIPGVLTVYPPKEPVESPVSLGIAVTVHTGPFPFCEKALRMVPRNVHLGVGCRKNTLAEVIEEKVAQFMAQNGLDWQAIAGVASIDLKKEEAGLVRFCENHNLPFTVYSAGELEQVEGHFTPSSFVGKVTGVENVCERSAALDCIRNRFFAKKQNLSGGYRMVQRKTAGGGVTVAAAMEDWSVRFE